MTSATTEVNIAASRKISRGLSDFPTEIVRLVFEASVTPGRRADNDRQRQRTAYTCCLVSQEVKAWVEPMLYEKVVLESSKQVMAFLDALESRSAEFLARTVKTVWILDETVLDDAIDRFHYMFSNCLCLEVLVSFDDYFCSKLLRLIPKPQNGLHALQELTIIQPGHRAARNLDLTHLSIQRLQIIDGHISFATSLYDRASTDEMFAGALRAIPHISFDFAVIPNMHHTSIIKSNLVPLLTQGMPGSKNVLCLRSSSVTRHRPDLEIVLKDVDSWVKTFDADVQRCGGRLLVCGKSDLEVGINPGHSRMERRRQWISLD